MVTKKKAKKPAKKPAKKAVKKTAKKAQPKKAAKKKVAKKKRAPAGSDTVVEREVQSALKGGPKSNQELRSQLGTEDKKLTRTLQRLRRRGLLKVVKGRWALTTVEICPKCGGKGWVKK